jgi:DnaK suppressor protein
MMIHPRSIDTSGAATNRMHEHLLLLLAERARVESEVRARLEGLRSGRIAAEDQASVLHEQFVSIRHNNFAYEKIKAIDAALERLDRGEYRICQECSEPISEKRLKAVPWTRYCLRCQESLSADDRPLTLRQLRAA